jgi:hypothetical protein
MNVTSAVRPARKTWIKALATTLVIVTTSSVVGLLTSTLVAIITAATCAIVVITADALVRASRTMDTIFDEELAERPTRTVVRLRTGTK